MFLTGYFVSSQYSILYNIVTGLLMVWSFNFLVKTIKRLYLLPAGPWGLPIVGYLPFLGEKSYLTFDKLAAKYGPVYSLKLGSHDVVVICDWEHLKIAFADEALLARPHELFFEGLLADPSFIEMSGEPWKAHRRLSLSVLRGVGLGKNTMEEAISKEIERFLPTLQAEDRVDFIKKLLPSVSNNISILLFGRSFDYLDPFKIELDDHMEQVNQTFQFAGLSAFLPWLVKPAAFLGLFNMGTIKKCMLAAEDSIQKEIDEHRVKDSFGDIGDYIDGYLQEQGNRQSKDDQFFNMSVLRRNVVEFFAAGSETVTSTLSWTMMYLIKSPEYQEKIRSEILETIGTERRPNYQDRYQMPFTMAFLYEAQRIGSVIATNLLRRASRDTRVGKYNIPKDTLVIFNLWSIHRDPNLWPEPEKFDPSRFLTDEGTKAVKPAHLVPFSGGKRICLGEGLANVELFLYLVNILQRYRVSCDQSTANLSFEDVFGVARRPKYLPLLKFEKI